MNQAPIEKKEVILPPAPAPNNDSDAVHESVPDNIKEDTEPIKEDEDNMAKEEPKPATEEAVAIVPEPVPEPKPMPAPEPKPEPESVDMTPTKELIVEQELPARPSMPRLEEESFKEDMELVPVVRRSRKKRSASASKSPKKTHKYKRCKKEHRRSKKTHRCNKKCPEGFKKNKTTKRCVKKGGKKRKN